MPFSLDEVEFELVTTVTSHPLGTITAGQQPTLDPSTVAQGLGPLDYYVLFSGISIDAPSAFALSSFSLDGLSFDWDAFAARKQGRLAESPLPP